MVLSGRTVRTVRNCSPSVQGAQFMLWILTGTRHSTRKSAKKVHPANRKFAPVNSQCTCPRVQPGTPGQPRIRNGVGPVGTAPRSRRHVSAATSFALTGPMEGSPTARTGQHRPLVRPRFVEPHPKPKWDLICHLLDPAPRDPGPAGPPLGPKRRRGGKTQAEECTWAGPRGGTPPPPPPPLLP